MSRLVLPPEAAHYATVVLRLGTDAPVILIDGSGLVATGHLELGDAEVAAHLDAVTERDEGESPLALELWSAIPKGDRWEWILQKATELGATVIQPLHTARGDVRIPPERLPSRLPRWQRVADEAARQCRRARAPEVFPPRTLAELAHHAAAPDAIGFAAHSTPAAPVLPLALALARQPAPPRAILAVGPEGGFTDAEAAWFATANFALVSLGPRILRVETAAVLGVGLIQHAWGDLG